MTDAYDFKGQVAIVTGGAAGIGLSTAESFARAGAHTVIADIDEERGNAEARRLADEGCSALYSKSDVRDSSQVKAMVTEVMARYGRVDIMVNNAGGWFGGSTLLETSEEEWDEIIKLNLNSVFLCCKAIVPHMMEQKMGRIVSVSSLAGRSAVQPSPVHYAAAKAGILGLTKNLALELGPHGITVNAVAPGTTRSPRVDKVRGPEVYRRIEETAPLRRVGEPADTAAAILFLASPAASYITGVVIDVAGGRFMP